MFAYADIRRYTGIPDEMILPRINYIGHPDLWGDLSRDAPNYPTADGKAPHLVATSKSSYPVDLARLAARLEELDGPCYLEIELGAAMFDIQTPAPLERAARIRSLAYIGWLMEFIREQGAEVMGIYQTTFRQPRSFAGFPGDGVPLRNDQNVWNLTGRPNWIILDLYGTPDQQWLARQAPRLERAGNLAKETDSPVVAFVTPGNRHEWQSQEINAFQRAMETIAKLPIDGLVLWMPGGENEHYAFTVPYQNAVKEVCDGDGVPAVWTQAD